MEKVANTSRLMGYIFKEFGFYIYEHISYCTPNLDYKIIKNKNETVANPTKNQINLEAAVKRLNY
jgi:hypothetical protein